MHRIGQTDQQKLTKGNIMRAIMIEGIYVVPTLVSLNQIKAGDTVLHDGKLKTVSPCAIKRDPFMRVSVWGDSYHIKRKIIKCKIFNGLKFIW
ncbi:hypothetical protein 2017DRC82_0070 [Vibrio phage ICP1]|nr:hypothetical protein 2017DRC106_0070 [Vibrio phage ICP1]QVV97643.1 hypothetical protein 2017DRC32_0070 [Vibrio phage ICP1]QVV97870.1 hypothetical protein 2017DRC48_0070 [Vibrio phage ICP1]QVV98097.1 hypothetical protein 2017DRC55_0070 [Vibrio phage ICP1]QVV98324.1 hypothetical protein 2017DRC72_0070 [Vibrio phage ICP1]